MPATGRAARCARTDAATGAWHPTTSRRPTRRTRRRSGPAPWARRRDASGWCRYRREAAWLPACRSSRAPPGRGLDGGEDAAVAGATTEVARQRFAHLEVGGRRPPVEQIVHGDDETRCAETALHGALVDEGLLDVGELAAVAEALDGRDVVPDGGGRQHEARAHQDTVDEHRARPALALLARALGPWEPEPLPQHEQQAL